MSNLETMRLDKWLWCARFYKTRGLATDEIGKGRVVRQGTKIALLSLGKGLACRFRGSGVAGLTRMRRRCRPLNSAWHWSC